MAESSALDTRDPALHRLVAADAELERAAAGLKFTEGPVWTGDALLFSDLPANRIARWRETPAGVELTTFRYPSGGPADNPLGLPQPGANGLTLDRQRRLIACEHGNRRVSRTELDGTVVTLADRYAGRRLNSPNDVVVRSDGLVFFSDPPYGLPNQEEGREQEVNAFYRVELDGRVVRLVDDFVRPNGLAFTPDERGIYLVDTRRFHLWHYTMTPEGDLIDGRIFADLSESREGGPDGVKVDAEGNVYCAAGAGIWVFAPDGAWLGVIRVPERPSNCAFGGPDWRSLFITARQSVYRIPLRVAGLPVG